MFNFSSMKRLCTLSIVSGALVLVSLHFTGCSKTPTIDPVVDLPIGVTLSDQGFTASDGSTGHFSRSICWYCLCWYCQPWSEWRISFVPAGIFANASSSMVVTMLSTG